MHSVKIRRIINECKGVKTFIFNIRETNLIKLQITPKPGQFMMIWVPGIDEIPMSISGYDEKGDWCITVKKVGDCTEALHELTIGDYIGIRGPFGTPFSLPNDKNQKIFLIGGGIGMAPLKFLAQELVKKDLTFTVIEGAKINDDLMFIDEFYYHREKLNEAIFCTDDGSYGTEGYASDVFKDAIMSLPPDELKKILVYTCGPEIMMYKVFEICNEHEIDLQASLERTMRCGCGLCGLCALDPTGELVCKDGPVFTLDQLKKSDDFGKYKRDFSGHKIQL